jgi:hypothetical protein
MYGCNDEDLFLLAEFEVLIWPIGSSTYFVLFRNVPHETHDLEARRRIQPTSWFIQEQDLRTGHQLAGNTDSPLLAARNTLANRCADQRVGLIL